MAMQTATVDILIDRAHFETRVAVAIAQAMDEAIDLKARQERDNSLSTLNCTGRRIIKMDN